MGIIGFLAALFCLTTLLCELVTREATKRQLLSTVREDRWSDRRVPVGGGIAINTIMLVGMCFVLDFKFLWELGPPLFFMALLGHFDDVFELQPQTKLIVQSWSAIWALYFGYGLGGVLGTAISFMWIIFVTNSFNLSDNMDGLCAGLVMLAGTALGLHFFNTGYPKEFYLICAMMTVCTAGFWLYNLPPARLFMGDVGTQPLGFLIAILTLKLIQRPNSAVYVLSAITYPVFDTVMTMALRFAAGRNVVKGNTDHLSHRLARVVGPQKAVYLILFLSLSVFVWAHAIQ